MYTHTPTLGNFRWGWVVNLVPCCVANLGAPCRLQSELGCAKVASANIETVFSGAGRISNKSRKLSPEILSNYAFCHYNYK